MQHTLILSSGFLLWGSDVVRRLCLLLCALACAFGLLLWRAGDDVPVSAPTASPTSAPTSALSPERVRVCIVPSRSAAATAAPTPEPPPIWLNVWNEGRVERVELEDYLVHVVAGEMPASYEPEALRAQAVATRSYIAWKLPAYGGSGCSRGGDVCTDSEHCMAYQSEEALRAHWGDRFDEYYEKILDAVQDTRGQVMTWNGEPIQALFHSASGGRTEDAQAVWGTAFPYLTSVESEGEENEQHTVRLTAKDLASRLNAAFDGAGLTAETVKTQFVVRSRTQSGRADTVKVGKVTATGKAVRAALDLSSANFTIDWQGSVAVLTTVGYGYGVGMSQVGANAMAQQGSTYRDILTHYYTGVTLADLSGLGA